MAKNNVFNRVEKAVQSLFVDPNYARLSDGTHSYSIENERFGWLNELWGADTFYKPKENLKSYYKSVYFLQECINLYADMASQVKIMEVDAKGNEVKDSPFLKMLNNPNPFQSRRELIKEMVINVLSTGGSFSYGNFFDKATMPLSPQLWNLEFNNLTFPHIKNRYIITPSTLSTLKLKEYIDAEIGSRNLTMAEVALFYDNIPNSGHGDNGFDGRHFFTPMSRLFAIMGSLHTLLDTQDTMAYLARNNVNKIVYKKYHDGTVAPLASDEKQDIEKKINGRGKYGSRKGKAGDTIASNEDLGVLDLTRDNKKLQMVPIQDNAKENVRNAFLIPKDYFGDSTYENKQFSEARFVLGNVKSLTDNWLGALEQRCAPYFAKNGTHLSGTYDHLPSIIETKVQLKNKGFKDRADALINIMTAYEQMVLIEPMLKWEDFLNRHQFDDFLRVD